MIADADALVRDHPQYKLVHRDFGSLDTVAWNLHRELFQDRNVRLALAIAVDVDRAITERLTSQDTHFGAVATRAVGSISPALNGYYRTGASGEITPLGFDPDAARTLLAQAGWSDTDGDGIVDRGGKKFSFELMYPQSSAGRTATAKQIQGDLANIGVEVRLLQLLAKDAQKFEQEGSFDAALITHTWGLTPDIRSAYHCERGEGLDPSWPHNYSNYCNATLDELMDDAYNSADAEARVDLWNRAQAMIYADQPSLFLWWSDAFVVLHRRFQDATPDLVSQLSGIDRWWVRPEDVLR